VMERRVSKPSMVAIVDDDESVREGLASLMKAHGLAAEAFASPEVFLRSGRSGAAACLITDFRMPGMTGIELYQQLVASGRSIPTILVTGYSNDKLRSCAANAGVLCYLTKPLNEEELLQWVRRAVGEPHAQEDG